MNIGITDTIIRHQTIAGTTIGLYNTTPNDIPFVDELIKHTVTFEIIDPPRQMVLDYALEHKLLFVIVHTPGQAPRVVDYMVIRILYVDVTDLTHNDILCIINRQLLYPRPDDSDVNYRYIELLI